MKNSLIYIVKQLLMKNNIAFDKNELTFQIQSHPSYPSLHSITGVLDHFNIENAAVEVPVDIKTLAQLPDSFIAQIKAKSGNELVLVQRRKLDYYIFYASNKKENITESVFLRCFTGVIVIVEKTKNTEKAQKNVFLKYVYFAALGVVITALLLIKSPSVFSLIYLLLSLTGVLISVSITKQEEGIQTSIGDMFCSSTNEKKDCDAVLTSKGAMVIKGYKLSDFSTIYFLAITITMFLMTVQKENAFLLYLISIIAMPVTLYSVYYQYAVVKKWCFLCLSIVGILWLQSLFFFLYKEYSFSISELLLTTFCFMVVFTSWTFLKSKYIALEQGKKAKIEYFKFKRNFNLFSKLLSQSTKLNTNLLDASEIIFGNQQSNLEVVIITNPFCGHCKPVHKLIENIINTYNNDVKIVIRFNVDVKDLDSDQVRVTTRLLEIYQEEGKGACLKAMSLIYEDTNVENWFNTWGICCEKEKYATKLKLQKKWCIENNINFTPEILVNGKPFPKEYNREELIYFIEDLYESSAEVAVLKAI